MNRGESMRESVSKDLIDAILHLGLPMWLIGDNKKAFPTCLMNKSFNGAYIVMLELAQRDIQSISKWEIEIKGRIDVEFVKFRGKVEISPLKDQPGYYSMRVLEMYKDNMRVYKRVPYRRSIQITEPVEKEAILINISASGAMIHTFEEIQGNQFKFHIILAKRRLDLVAEIIEQTYVPDKQIYIIRCQFNPIDKNVKQHINKVVREIILMAKKRLKG